MCRLCGPAYNVARQLAGSASWGGMLVSEEVWKEQGNYGRLWVYNQGVSMSWGRVISCFALSPEGHGAYLHSNALPTRKTCSKPFLQTLDDDDDLTIGICRIPGMTVRHRLAPCCQHVAPERVALVSQHGCMQVLACRQCHATALPGKLRRQWEVAQPEKLLSRSCSQCGSSPYMESH